MAKDLALVLNSGSVNSLVTTALAAQRFRLVMLHAEIDPMPGSRVRAAFDLQASHFKPYREHTLSMPYLAAVAGTSQAQQSGAIAADPRQAVPVAPQVLELLPLMAAAARYAAHYNAASIFLGLRIGIGRAGDKGGAEELAQATEYVQIWNELLNLPCGLAELDVVAPLLELEQWQVIDVGTQAGAPFEKTWSCVEELSDPCWACRGCRARQSAFQQAGKPDPLRTARKV
jgi:7-cyano-7-deazaguanine synthase